MFILSGVSQTSKDIQTCICKHVLHLHTDETHRVGNVRICMSSKRVTVLFFDKIWALKTKLFYFMYHKTKRDC